MLISNSARKGVLMRTIGHFINAQSVTHTGAVTTPVFDPSSGQVQALLEHGDTAILAEAVAVAKAAQPAWAATNPQLRARVIYPACYRQGRRTGHRRAGPELAGPSFAGKQAGSEDCDPHLYGPSHERTRTCPTNGVHKNLSMILMQPRWTMPRKFSTCNS